MTEDEYLKMKNRELHAQKKEILNINNTRLFHFIRNKQTISKEGIIKKKYRYNFRKRKGNTFTTNYDYYKSMRTI